jgi:hypothetical protein
VVLVDVDYWIQQRLHPGVLVMLLDDVDARPYRIENGQSEDYRPVCELCDRYADLNVGFVTPRCSRSRSAFESQSWQHSIAAILACFGLGTFTLQLLPEVIPV